MVLPTDVAVFENMPLEKLLTAEVDDDSIVTEAALDAAKEAAANSGVNPYVLLYESHIVRHAMQRINV